MLVTHSDNLIPIFSRRLNFRVFSFLHVYSLDFSTCFRRHKRSRLRPDAEGRPYCCCRSSPMIFFAWRWICALRSLLFGHRSRGLAVPEQESRTIGSGLFPGSTESRSLKFWHFEASSCRVCFWENTASSSRCKIRRNFHEVNDVKLFSRFFKFSLCLFDILWFAGLTQH